MCQRPRAAHRRLDQRWFQPFDHPGGERLPAGRWLSLRQLADRQFTAIPTRLGLLGFRDLTAGGGRLHPRADHHVVLHGGAAVCGYGHPWSALCPFVRGAGIYLRVHPDDWHHRDWLRGSGDCLNGELATGPATKPVTMVPIVGMNSKINASTPNKGAYGTPRMAIPTNCSTPMQDDMMIC